MQQINLDQLAKMAVENLMADPSFIKKAKSKTAQMAIVEAVTEFLRNAQTNLEQEATFRNIAFLRSEFITFFLKQEYHVKFFAVGDENPSGTFAAGIMHACYFDTKNRMDEIASLTDEWLKERSITPHGVLESMGFPPEIIAQINDSGITLQNIYVKFPMLIVKSK